MRRNSSETERAPVAMARAAAEAVIVPLNAVGAMMSIAPF
jgi:hypothetical protein